MKADYNPTGRIATVTTQEPSMIDYVKELKRLKQDKLIKRFSDKAKIQKIEALVDNSFCSQDMKAALNNLFTKRHKELLRGLQN